jgi:hypothetical protein
LLAKFSPNNPIVIAWFLERTFAKPSNKLYKAHDYLVGVT